MGFPLHYSLYARTKRAQKRATDPQLLELCIIVNDHVGARNLT